MMRIPPFPLYPIKNPPGEADLYQVGGCSKQVSLWSPVIPDPQVTTGHGFDISLCGYPIKPHSGKRSRRHGTCIRLTNADDTG